LLECYVCRFIGQTAHCTANSGVKEQGLAIPILSEGVVPGKVVVGGWTLEEII